MRKLHHPDVVFWQLPLTCSWWQVRMEVRARIAIFGFCVLVWPFMTTAADLTACPRLTERERNMVESAELDCIAEERPCTVLIMTAEEAGAKGREVADWNASNATDVERRLSSSFGACDAQRQVFILTEIVHRRQSSGPPTRGVPPHWERASASGYVFLDDRGKRWWFPRTVRAGNATYVLDTTRPPKFKRAGSLVFSEAVYRANGLPSLVHPGRMVAPPPDTDPRAHRGPSQSELCRTNPQLYSCLRR